ncbi:hypothetical protein PENSPDRAFT_740264 [Peniophora sp. CONT]|nr:hypothetical protein PENSPDRAFT_740264 [Peniophora sp. CONT]
MSKDTTDFTVIIPDETLCSIFSFVRSIDPIQSSVIYSLCTEDAGRLSRLSSFKLGWINITHVNSRWRAVAIDDATLWTCLTGQLGACWLDEFIRRGKSAPLAIDNSKFQTLYRNSTDRISDNTLSDLLAAHSTRISSLWLHAPSIRLFGDVFAISFGALEEVFLSSSTSNTDFTYPVRMLLDHTPRLRRLQLSLWKHHYTTFDWAHTAMSNLTSLDIFMAGPLLSEDILEALRHMSVLSDLCLSESLTGTAPLFCTHRCPATSAGFIYLGAMKSMILDTSMETHAHMLRHIRLPSDARLTLTISRNPSTDLSVHDALSRELRSFLPSYQGVDPYRCAHLAFEDDMGMTCVYIELVRMRRLDSTVGGFNIDGEWPHRLNSPHLSLHIVTTMCPTILPLLYPSSIHTLDILDKGASASHVAAQLSFFHNVERLRLGTSSSVLKRQAVRVLQDPTLLPLLRILDMDSETFDLAWIVECHGALEDGLEARRLAGRPLEEVYLHVEEDVALINQGCTDETSCRDPPQYLILEVIERLEAMDNLQIVSKDFDPFATWL